MRYHQRARHKVDLIALQAVWAANYAAVLALLPEICAGQGRCFEIGAPGQSRISLRIVERGSHTVVLDLAQNDDGSFAGASPPHFKLRVYHDARMAEVIASQGHRLIKPRYDYPNRCMYQRDEKYQINRLFGEWLRYCLAHHRSDSAASGRLPERPPVSE